MAPALISCSGCSKVSLDSLYGLKLWGLLPAEGSQLNFFLGITRCMRKPPCPKAPSRGSPPYLITGWHESTKAWPPFLNSWICRRAILLAELPTGSAEMFLRNASQFNFSICLIPLLSTRSQVLSPRCSPMKLLHPALHWSLFLGELDLRHPHVTNPNWRKDLRGTLSI